MFWCDLLLCAWGVLSMTKSLGQFKSNRLRRTHRSPFGAKNAVYVVTLALLSFLGYELGCLMLRAGVPSYLFSSVTSSTKHHCFFSHFCLFILCWVLAWVATSHQILGDNTRSCQTDDHTLLHEETFMEIDAKRNCRTLQICSNMIPEQKYKKSVLFCVKICFHVLTS